MEFIQRRWRDEEILRAPGVVFATGEQVHIKCVEAFSEEGPDVRVQVLGRGAVDPALEFDESAWTFACQQGSCDWEPGNLRLSCGECSWGSDGYVAATQLSDGQLVWVAFFDRSNPFREIKVIDGRAVAVSTYDDIWTFPLDHPERVTVGR